MSQWLRVSNVFDEDLSLVLSTCAGWLTTTYHSSSGVINKIVSAVWRRWEGRETRSSHVGEVVKLWLLGWWWELGKNATEQEGSWGIRKKLATDKGARTAARV